MQRDPEIRNLMIETLRLVVQAEAALEQSRKINAQFAQVLPRLQHVVDQRRGEDRRLAFRGGRRSSDLEEDPRA